MLLVFVPITAFLTSVIAPVRRDQRRVAVTCSISRGSRSSSTAHVGQAVPTCHIGASFQRPLAGRLGSGSLSIAKTPVVSKNLIGQRHGSQMSPPGCGLLSAIRRR